MFLAVIQTSWSQIYTDETRACRCYKLTSLNILEQLESPSSLGPLTPGSYLHRASQRRLIWGEGQKLR